MKWRIHFSHSDIISYSISSTRAIASFYENKIVKLTTPLPLYSGRLIGIQCQSRRSSDSLRVVWYQFIKACWKQRRIPMPDGKDHSYILINSYTTDLFQRSTYIRDCNNWSYSKHLEQFSTFMSGGDPLLFQVLLCLWMFILVFSDKSWNVFVCGYKNVWLSFVCRRIRIT